MHKSSFDKMERFKKVYLEEKAEDPLTVLDLGSQDVNGSYRTIFDSQNWNYIGMDMVPGDNVDIVLKSPYDWGEIKSNSIDVLISGQAFEHIEFFWITMLEVYRVLTPGGFCCIIAPSGGYEHRYPVDCWRFYPDGFSALGRFSELEIIKAETQWEDRGYDDGSDVWKDSILVCQKPKMQLYKKIKGNVRNRLQHKILTRWIV